MDSFGASAAAPPAAGCCLSGASAAERFVEEICRQRDASHDFAHSIRVRNLALSLAREEKLTHDSFQVIELAALLHDVDDHKYKQSCDQNGVGSFLDKEGYDAATKERVLHIIKCMGFKEQLAKEELGGGNLELAVVQDADRLDAIGAIGIARCFTYGGSRNHVLYDPALLPVVEGLSKEEYTRKDRQQTMINHFYEKLLKLKGLMKTEAGRKRAEQRHAFMEKYLAQFFMEWNGEF